MGGTDLTVLVVDDDFRVANMHAGIVDAMPGFVVAATANTLAAARRAAPVDLALVDVYLPDGSGIDFIRELRSDSMVLTAATEADTVRSAMAAGAVSYLVKPFATTELAARLSGYARYRKILSSPNLSAADVDSALDALRPKVVPVQSTTTVASPTKKLVLQALHSSEAPMSAAEVAGAIGISRATAQRYLAALATTGEVSVGLRYGTTGRPEQEFAAANRSARSPRGSTDTARGR
ncbi:response regulator [Mycobacterium sp. TY814]|uniref:response regulator n=1 Tax=unclassified Mycobacterium TaxID=2642494 RepID=UPI002740843E|nr:response regulator [Mycobacterium sp. TY814]MDP7724614.1 response regulator [Mycobacterium sp. TY814]